jgi:hypothetical protein
MKKPPLFGSVPDRVILTGAPLLVWMFILLTAAACSGGGGGGGDGISTGH